MPESAIKAALILGFVLGISLLAFGLWLLFVKPLVAVFVILVSAVCFGYWIMAFQTALVQFAFNDEGVRAKYPMESEHFYCWEDFQQVCVCYYSRATEMSGYPLICLVRKGEKPDYFGRWKTGSVFHYRRLLCLDYSEEQLQEIRIHCPYEIPDLRGKGNYRL